MAFDHVASNLRRMTRSQMLRYPQPRLHAVDRVAVGDLDREALRLKVPDPAAAAAAAWILGDCDLPGRFSSRSVKQRKNWKQSEDRGELTSVYCFGHGTILFPLIAALRYAGCGPSIHLLASASNHQSGNRDP